MGPLTYLKGVSFQVCKIKDGNLGVMDKIRLKSYHRTLTFGVLQLFDMVQPRVRENRKKGPIFRLAE